MTFCPLRGSQLRGGSRSQYSGLAIPLCSPRNTNLCGTESVDAASEHCGKAAAHLNFLRGFEYDPTVDCDAIVGSGKRVGKECAEKGKGGE